MTFDFFALGTAAGLWRREAAVTLPVEAFFVIFFMVVVVLGGLLEPESISIWTVKILGTCALDFDLVDAMFSAIRIPVAKDQKEAE